MIQALIATIIELVSIMFAMGAGAFFEEKNESKGGVCLGLAILLGACALGVAAK